MSQRERWAVYPLLFFCVVMCLQVRGCPPGAREIESKTLSTEHLTIIGRNGQPSLELGTSAQGAGYVRVYGFRQPRNQRGGNNLPAVVMTVDQQSGVVETRSSRGSPLVMVTHGAGGSGNVVIYDRQGRARSVPLIEVRRSSDAGTKPDDKEPEDPSGEVPPIGEEDSTNEADSNNQP